MTIDVHAHCVPTGVVETLVADGGRYGIEIAEQEGKRRAIIAGLQHAVSVLGLLCLVHGGGFAPYQLGRWDRGYRVNARGAAEHLTRAPSEWLQRLLFDTVLHSPDSLRFLIDTVGVGQVVLGSDYPFEMGEPDPIATIDGVGMSDAERAQVLAGNLERVLGAIRR